ncbi:MAG: alpha/beta hydrolase [Ktedonobacteraceae bacterium]
MHIVDQAEVIPIWPGDPPGSEDWTQLEQEIFAPPPIRFRSVRNVTQPTLTAFLPHPSKATGTAVIICPGGGFHALAIDHEGRDVARWLNTRGVAAFVLKYRLLAIEVRDEDFERQFQENLSDRNKIREVTKQIGPLAIADGQQAVRIVRKRASEWGLAPNRIGIMGFSAGGRVTAGVALEHDAQSRPNFAAPIYGALWEDITVPADAPPLFMALANDDELAVEPGLALYSAWRAAGHPVELHIYAQGGHGFGMRKQGLPADHWIDRFGEWLQIQGFLA